MCRLKKSRGGMVYNYICGAMGFGGGRGREPIVMLDEDLPV